MKVPMGVPTWGRDEVQATIRNLICQVSKKNNRSIVELKKSVNTSFNAKFCVPTELGRQAIFLALKGIGMKAGDKVLMPSYVCSNVLLPVLALQCIPVFIDIDQESYSISPNSLKENLKFGARCIIIPHLYGKAASVKRLLNIARENNLFVIDDAAQGGGAKVDGKFLGTYGDAGILSFGPYKSIIAPKGGALITNREDIIDRLNIKFGCNTSWFESYSRLVKMVIKFSVRKYTYSLLVKSKRKKKNIKNKGKDSKQNLFFEVNPVSISPLDAAITVAQIKKLDHIIHQRIRLAERLNGLLSDCDWLTTPQLIDNIFVKYIIRLNSNKFTNVLISFLKKNGIEAGSGYRPLHYSYPNVGQFVSLSNTEKIWSRIICLPLDAKMKITNVEYVYKIIKKFEKTYNLNAN